ncbi:MAG TPA: radical SAM protein [candidate division Zixibacteria bacterium]|nr:radical SAM protein [candidate division Zixibacteria bacterium]
MISFSPSQIERLHACVECPRRCGSDRFEAAGFCSSPPVPKLSSANLHHGEEPPISGTCGSGTFFFAGCNMACVFCQNYPLSQLGHGTDITLDILVEKMLALQKRGAHNINFVTPSHATIALEAAIPAARNTGLSIPIVYNSSGYDSIEQLRRLEGLIEIYMPDIRYQRVEPARELSNAPDYPEVNRAALKEMHRQVGDLKIGDDGIAVRGLIVRHLVLPEGRADTEKALKFLVEEISPDTYVSLMAQYFPAYRAGEFSGMNRRLTKTEWRPAYRAFEKSGLNGWAQEY